MTNYIINPFSASSTTPVPGKSDFFLLFFRRTLSTAVQNIRAFVSGLRSDADVFVVFVSL